MPVLSLQITVVHPSVSTEGRDRTIAFNFAILFVPSARHLHKRKRNLVYYDISEEEISKIKIHNYPNTINEI